MTNEEAIKIFKEVREEVLAKETELSRQVFENLGIKAIDVAIKALEQARWIPVNERLPETDGIYLTYIKNPYDNELSYIMLCDYICPKWFPVDETASSNVIAWMPLPEPYNESEE